MSLVILMSILTVGGKTHANQFDTLRIYWQNQLTGTNLSASTLTSYASTATNYWKTINTNSSRTYLWSDLPPGTNSAYMSSTFGRLQSMALAWATTNCPLQTNAALGTVITNAMDWVCANVYTTNATEYFNWWDWEIGSLQALNNIVVLMYPSLTPAQITNYNNSVDYFGPNKPTGGPGIAPNNGWMTGANLTDQCKGRIIRAITGQDTNKLSNAQTNLSPVFPYVTTSDGFYRDGSFIQHTTHPYAGGYGVVALSDIAQLVNLLYGSAWQITDPNLTNVFNWVSQSFEPIIYNGNWMAMVCGRGISRGASAASASSAINAAVQVAQFAPAATASAILNWTNSLSMPPGQYHFPCMDRVVAWRSNFCAGLSMSSSRVSNYESINGENLHGWFTGDGMLYLYLGDPDTQFVSDFWPTVDAYHLPGTTVQTSARANSVGQSQLTGQPWVGGAQVAGQCGTVGMSLAAYGTTLTAKKSWFMFDNEIVCLGAGITCGDSAEVDTTVENRRLGTSPNNNFTVNGFTNPPVMGWVSNLTSTAWCALDGVAGYYFPGGATNLRAAFVTNTGSWSNLDDGSHNSPSTNLYTDSYLTLWFNHGIKPTNANYAYVILPNFTANSMAAYSASPDIVLLSNTPTIQAASKPGLGVVAANFWVDGTNSADLIKVNKKSAVITQETTQGISVGIADPTQTNSGTISVTLNRSAVLAASADPGLTVVQISPQIVISANVNGSLGKTYQASFLYSPVTLTWDADTTTTGAQDGSGDWDNPGTNWWDSAADISWNDSIASIAAFGAGGAAGTVTLTNSHTAYGLAFNAVGSGAYTLTGTGLLTVTNGISVNASATVGLPLNLPTSQSWVVASNQILNVTGSVTMPETASLLYAGGGTLTLSGQNTNNGVATINAGTLLVNGNSLACTNTVTVSSNAVFGGIGTNGGSVILNAGGQLAPGGLNNIGTLTITNSLTLNSGTLFIAMATNTPTTNDLVNIGNRLTLNGANTVILSVSSMIPAGNYTLMTFAGGYTGAGTFALGGSMTNNASLQLNANNLVLQVGVGGIYTFTDTWKGYTSGTWSASALNWTNGNPVVPYQNNDAVIFDDTLVKNSVISNAIPGAVVYPGSMTFSNSFTNYTIRANIGGTNLLVKYGAATVALTGTNNYSGNTTINGGALVVTNGGTIISPSATLNIGAQAGTAGMLTLSNNTSAITVQTLLVTNVACGGPTNSIFSFNGGSLITSNNNGIAANILLASNASWTVNGNWNLNAGLHLVSNVATNGNASANVYLGNATNNVQIGVNGNTVLWLAIPTNSSATNTLGLVLGYNNATNNVLTVNDGTLVVSNRTGSATPIIAGYSANSAGNQIVITNGGQIFTRNQGSGGVISGIIGNSTGPNNSLMIAGANAAGQKSMWDLGADRLNIGTGVSSTNDWVRVDQGGIITNVTIFAYGNYTSLLITNGGQVFASGCVIGRSGINSKLVVAGMDVAGNPAMLKFPTTGTLTIGGGTGTPSAPAPGTNSLVRVDAGGIITNVGSINIGQDTNSVGNVLVITNGGQVFSTNNSAVGYVAGCNNNAAVVGGGSGFSVWDLGNHLLTIGNDANSTNNSLTLLSGGAVTNLAGIVLGGINSLLKFNGGMLVADASGNLIATNAGTLNATNFVQVGGAVINDNGYLVASQLTLLQDPGSVGGGLTKLGAGTLTLSGTNTYSGPTLVKAGTLALNDASAIPASANITVAGGAIFDSSGLSWSFIFGGGQTLSNSAVGAMVAGTNDCSAGRLALVYDGTAPSFTVTNGALILSSNTVFSLNNPGATLPLGSYQLVANTVLGNTGAVVGAIPTNVTFTGGSLAGTPVLEILLGNLYLGVGGRSSAISYLNTVFTNNGTGRSPTIIFVGSTGAKTTNYVGISVSYGPSINPPTNAGIYYVSNTVAGDGTYYGATNGTLFTILPRALATVSFSATNSGLPLNPAFCGLSYEKTMLTKSLFVSTNTALINMYAQIAPAVFRIGANGVDTTCWGNLSNLTAITPAQVDAFAGFIKALPTNWHVIYGINMSVNNATNCAAEAAYVANALGSSLLGFEIGNECDLYKGNGFRPTSYTFANFLSEWRVLAAAITNTVPGWAITNGGNGWTLTGPVSAYDTSGYTVPFATNEAGVASMVTQHYYRGNATNPSSTMTLLLSPDANLISAATSIVAAATSAHLVQGFRMDECGSFYNGGNTISSQYGAALWTLDFMFTLATNGCQGVNFHGGGQSYSSYTPIADNGISVVMARPEFYGLKLFSLANQGNVLPASITLNTNVNFTAYGVKQSAGVIGAILNNKDTNYYVQVAINLGSNVVAASTMSLAGASLDSSNGYTLGGMPINADGSWTGGFQSVISASNGQLTVTVPPITAVWLSPVTEGTNMLLTSDGSGTSSFTGATNWTDGLMPHIYANYFTSTNLLLSPASGSGYVFAGDSLTLGPSVAGNTSFRLMFAAPGGACTINNCIVSGGIIDAGMANTTNYLSGSWLVASPGGFGLGGDKSRAMVLTNFNLSGASTLSNGVAGNGGGTIIYAGNAANFTGPVATSFGTTLQSYSQTNLGGNPSSFNAAQFILDSGVFQPLTSMSLINANSGMTLNPGGGTFNVASGLTLTIGNPISGPGGLTNSGGGQLVLTGTNSYTGATAINAGTLMLNGNSLACTNTITVASGATLGGIGTNGGSVILNAGGQLAPGLTNNIGTLVLTNNLTLNGSYLLFNLAGVANDRVAVGNNLTANGTNPVILSYTGSIPQGNYTLMTFTNVTGTIANFTLAGYVNATLALNANSLVLQVGAGGLISGDVWKGYVNGTWDTTTGNWTNNLPGTYYGNGDVVTFDDSLVGNSTISNSTPGGIVTPGSVTFNNNLTNYTVNANIGGTSSLTLSGSATVTLGGTNTYAGNTIISAGTLIVPNGGAIYSPAGILNIGSQAGVVGTNTLASGGTITVQTLLATNVLNTGLTTNFSIFNFTGGTLTTSNGTGSGYAAGILLASNVSWTINGNWNLNGGTNLISTVATNSNPVNYVYFGNGANNLRLNVNPGAVWWTALPTNSTATNILSLVIGNGNATNNVVTVNGGKLIATNRPGAAITPIIIGNAAGSVSGQLIITNGGQVFTSCRQDYGTIGGLIGGNGNNNSAIVAGTNTAGLKATWNMGRDRLTIGNNASSNSWVRVDQGGVITNCQLYEFLNSSSLFITNGGQIFANRATVGRNGINNSLVVGGADSAGNPALLAFYTDSGAPVLTIGGGSVTTASPGTNNAVLVSSGGLITNVTSIYIGGTPVTWDSNSIANALVITNGGQVFSTGTNAIGLVNGCNSNSATVGGGGGTSLWYLGNQSLTIGNNAGASNNYVALFSGGLLTNVSTVFFGGVNSALYFNGGTLAAGGNGNLLATNNTAVNATNYVQAGGAFINDNGFTVTNPLALLQDPNSLGGGLTKLGSGSLTLAGTTNTYAGNTTVSGGTLRLMQPTLATNSTVTVSNVAVLNLNFTGTNVVAAFVTNGVSLPPGIYNNVTAAPYLTGAGSLLVPAGGGSSPLINATVTFTNFISTYGTASPAQNFAVSGVNLTGSITGAAAPGFELSTNSSTAYGNTAVIPASGGNASGTIYIRLSATAPVGSYNSSNIVVLSSPGATSVTNSSTSSGNVVTAAGSGWSYGATAFTYNGTGQGPGITFSGSSGLKTTNYVGLTLSYGPSASAPTNAGGYYVSNTVAGDGNYFGATNSQNFIINPTNPVVTYGGGSFIYTGSGQGPAINFNGADGVKTTNYVGVLPTSYGPGGNAPTNAGSYYVTNTLANGVNYLGTNTAFTFAIIPTTNALVLGVGPGIAGYGQVVSVVAAVQINGTNRLDATSNVVYVVDGTRVATNGLASGTNVWSTGGLPVGVHNVSAIYTGDNNFSNSVSGTNGVTVNLAVPVLTLRATAITYGQTLGSSSLGGSVATNGNNGALVLGSYAFATPAIIPNAGVTNVSVVFTPTDGVDYSSVTNLVPVTINPSSNAYLTSFGLNPAGTLTPGFATNIFSYTATETYGNQPSVTVTNADLSATNQLVYNHTTNLLVSGVTSAALTLNPNPGITNMVQVQVRAQDGVTVLTYTVQVQQLPSQSRPTMSNSLSGTNMTLSWPLANVGYRLLVQTNKLVYGISPNTNDWMTVPNSMLTNQISLPLNPLNASEFYRLVYPQ